MNTAKNRDTDIVISICEQVRANRQKSDVWGCYVGSCMTAIRHFQKGRSGVLQSRDVPTRSDGTTSRYELTNLKKVYFGCMAEDELPHC